MADLGSFITKNFPVNRVVALLAPVIIGVAATVSTWLADHLPFIAEQVGPDELEKIFLASVAAGVAALWKWFDGRQDEAKIKAIKEESAPAEKKVEAIGKVGAK